MCAASAELSLERVESSDLFLQFMGLPYQPSSPPVGKIRTSNLLFQSFREFPCPAWYRTLVDDLRAELGPLRTVWGLKKLGNRYVWEFYFYKVAEGARKMRLCQVLPVFGKHCEVDIGNYDETLDYSAFSIDLDGVASRISAVHIYYQHPDFDRAWVFKVGAGGFREFENDYAPFRFRTNPERSRRHAALRLRLSPFGSGSMLTDDVLLPELDECDAVFLSAKRHAFGVYYLGISTQQFILFLERFNYSRPLLNFVCVNSGALDYVKWDVGYDFRYDDGHLNFIKSGFYGTF